MPTPWGCKSFPEYADAFLPNRFFLPENNSSAKLERRVQELDSPLRSLGISSILAAAIRAESDPIADFAYADSSGVADADTEQVSFGAEEDLSL